MAVILSRKPGGTGGGGGGPPSGPAGGDLTGTYPNPTIGSGAAADGLVLTSDGAGGSDWEASAGGTPPAQSRAVISGVTQFSQPGLVTRDTTTWTSSANRAQYFPFFVETSIVIDQLVFRLTTGVAASTVRACIYPADTSWQPGTMVANTDTGNLTATAAQQGLIATTITDTTLVPGRYLFWFAASTGNHVLESPQASVSRYLGYPAALTAGSFFFSQIFVAQTYGAPPSSGLAWTSTSVTASGLGFAIPLFVRIKTP